MLYDTCLRQQQHWRLPCPTERKKKRNRRPARSGDRDRSRVSGDEATHEYNNTAIDTSWTSSQRQEGTRYNCRCHDIMLQVGLGLKKVVIVQPLSERRFSPHQKNKFRLAAGRKKLQLLSYRMYVYSTVLGKYIYIYIVTLAHSFKAEARVATNRTHGVLRGK